MNISEKKMLKTSESFAAYSCMPLLGIISRIFLNFNSDRRRRGTLFILIYLTNVDTFKITTSFLQDICGDCVTNTVNH